MFKKAEGYYNRTADCFSSHRQFPFDRESEYPALLLGQQVGYCAFPLFADYILNGNRIYRDVIRYLLENLLPEPSVKILAPSSVESTVREKNEKRLVFLLHYIPERRTKTIDIVDTRQSMLNTKILVQGEYGKVRLLCSGEEYPIEKEKSGYSSVEIPYMNGFECLEFC